MAYYKQLKYERFNMDPCCKPEITGWSTKFLSMIPAVSYKKGTLIQFRFANCIPYLYKLESQCKCNFIKLFCLDK